MAVRSALPWPLRWAAAAIVIGFCAAIGLWAFEFGKGIAGLTRARRKSWCPARRVARAAPERDQAQSVFQHLGSLLTAEKTAQEQLATQIRHSRPRT